MDPLMTLPEIAAYAKVGAGEVRRDMKRAKDDKRFLPGILHRGKLKARLSDVDAWIDRSSTSAT